MEKLISNQGSTNSDIFRSLNFTYKTKELSFFQKLCQVYWANPKSWLLDSLTIKDGNIEVVLRNGHVFISPLSELKVRKQTDQYDRTELYLSYNNDKVHFKEIPGMLEPEEWTQIIEVMDAVKDSDISLLGKITKVTAMGEKILKGIID